MELNKLQDEFFQAVLAGENIFLTGKAGTGKSFVIRAVIKALEEKGKKVVAVAPTGIAANNINGQTIHSMFSINPFGVASYDTCNFVKKNKRRLLQVIDTILIDEISMLRPDILDAMHWTLIKNGLDGLNKKQIIFIGDLKQLPSVLDDNTRSVLYQTYDGDTFLYSRIIQKISLKTIELDEVIRQTNLEFIENLNIIRDGGRSEYFRKFLHTEPEGIILAPHNTTVQKYNEKGLSEQKGEEFVFDATIVGEVKETDFKFETKIRVKNGCKIMYLVNSENNPLRNGTIGTFVSHAGCHYIRVGETDFALEPQTVSKKEYIFDEKADKLVLQEIASITQYPIKLAYALSIHKSQGLTFEKVTVDLSRPCFQKGQMYVALSRVTAPEGLRIII